MTQLSTPSDVEPPVADLDATPKPSAGIAAWAVFLAALLVGATIVHHHFSADAFAWAVVQVMLVGVAAYDFATRLVKNVVTIPVSILAILLRAVFERSSLIEVVIAGLVVFVVVLGLSLVLRGGLGMGDVKLAGMLGFLLGWKVVPALFFGTIAGGVGAAVILSRSGERGSTIAYGPYLALGGALAIVLAHPPHLI